MTLDPKSLKLYISVLKHKTIAAAAGHEHIAAAAVSRRLSDLEEQLGVALLNRSNKGITPTAAGSALLTMAHQALYELDRIQDQMKDYVAGIKGYIRILANMSAIHQFMPTVLGNFLADNPLVQIDLEETLSSAIAQLIADNTADIGVLVKGTAVEGVEFLPYQNDRLVVISSLEHPLAAQDKIRFVDTLAYDYVGLPQGSQLNTQLSREAAVHGQMWRCRFQVASYDALCRMVEAGLGIGVLPKTIAQAYVKALKIKMLILDETWAHRSLHICIRSYQGLSPAARLLVDKMLKNNQLFSSS